VKFLKYKAFPVGFHRIYRFIPIELAACPERGLDPPSHKFASFGKLRAALPSTSAFVAIFFKSVVVSSSFAQVPGSPSLVTASQERQER
jgi:hypothetical protein